MMLWAPVAQLGLQLQENIAKTACSTIDRVEWRERSPELLFRGKNRPKKNKKSTTTMTSRKRRKWIVPLTSNRAVRYCTPLH